MAEKRLSLEGRSILRAAFGADSEAGEGVGALRLADPPSRRGSTLSTVSTDGRRASQTSSVSDRNILHEGWLLVRGAMLKNWKKRWAMLRIGEPYTGLGLEWADINRAHGQNGSVDSICGVEAEAQLAEAAAGAADDDNGGASFAFSVHCSGADGQYREVVLRAADAEGCNVDANPGEPLREVRFIDEFLRKEKDARALFVDLEERFVIIEGW